MPSSCSTSLRGRPICNWKFDSANSAASTGYDLFISSATLRIAWSSPRPASTHTTIRSKASGRAGKIACLRLRPTRPTIRSGRYMPRPAAKATITSELRFMPRSARIVLPPMSSPAIRPANLMPRKTRLAPSPRKPALVSFNFSLLSSMSVLGCNGLAKAGAAFSSTLRHGALLLDQPVFARSRRRGDSSTRRAAPRPAACPRPGGPARTRRRRQTCRTAAMGSIASKSSRAFCEEHGAPTP